MRNTLKPKLTFLSRQVPFLGRPVHHLIAPSLLAGAVLMSLAACSSKWHEVAAKAPNTGDTFSEKQVAPESTRSLQSGDTGYVSTDHLPARTSADQKPEEAPAHLEKNDKIRVVAPAPEGSDGSMQAVVVSTDQPDLKGKTVIVNQKYVSSEPVPFTNDELDRNKYFMIQNIATERVRVYLNCASKDGDGNCVHKMVFETEMTAGEDTPSQSRRTILGSYRLEKWFKFYEDHAHNYPAFYAPDSPRLPEADKELKDWMSPSLLPASGGVMRGSFGWYTAYLEPNASTQWTHGTFGWGKDGEKFIEAVKDPSNKLKMDVGSQGCTRVENQAIALMREILPPGTRILKIYAREGYADPTLARYQNMKPAKWKWVLTKKRGADAPRSSAKLAADQGEDEILDKGTYTLKQIPTAIPVDRSLDGSGQENGDIYNVPVADMKGVFLVDEGRLAGYQHPTELKVGGETDHGLPSIVISTRTDVKPVKPIADIDKKKPVVSNDTEAAPEAAE